MNHDHETRRYRWCLAAAGALLLGACQGAEGGAAETAAQSQQADASSEGSASPVQQSGSKRGTATLTIGSREPLTAVVTCALEPWEDILFYATTTTTTEPNFAIQVMAADAPRADANFVDLATGVTWYGGPDVVAMLDGNVISGTGTFSKEGDGADEQLGTFNVTCPD